MLYLQFRRVNSLVRRLRPHLSRSPAGRRKSVRLRERRPDSFLRRRHSPRQRSTSLRRSRRRMSVTPGRRTRLCLDIVSFIICIILIVVQMGVLDYYFIRNLDSSFWYAWILADIIVIFVMLWLLLKAIKYNQRCMDEACTTDANIKYAFIGWLVYTMVLCAKVITSYRFYYDDVVEGEQLLLDESKFDVEHKFNWDHMFGMHTYRMCLALSCPIFLLLVEAHHYTRLNSPRQLYLSYLVGTVTLDLLDTIHFMDLLWMDKEAGWELDHQLTTLILILSCLNLLLPTFSLVKLRYSTRLPRWLPMNAETLYSLIYVSVVNLPYMAIRCYLGLRLSGTGQGYDTSLFVVKNVVMLYLAVRDLWLSVQIWRQKKKGPRKGDEEILEEGEKRDEERVALAMKDRGMNNNNNNNREEENKDEEEEEEEVEVGKNKGNVDVDEEEGNGVH